jgi:hypothetical protein
VTANAVATADFTLSVPVLSPTYIRQNPTKCTYTWDVAGLATQVACP